MNTGRSEDINQLYRQLYRETDSKRKREIKDSIQIIKNESGAIRSMRESLIKAHRNNDVMEIKDIHDYIKNKSKYKNE
jgi:hypothetical protein